MIAFIDDHRGAYGIEPICRVSPIAPSTCRAHASQRTDPAKLSIRARRDAALLPEVRRVFDENCRVYGVRKVWRQMTRERHRIARCTVARLMRRAGLQGVIRGKPVRATFSDKAAPCPLDQVNRPFKAPRPNVPRLSDFTLPVTGMLLVQAQSGIRFHNSKGIAVPWPEDEIDKHFFDPTGRVCSDKLSKLVIRCTKKSGGAVIDRISRVFPNVFVDEVQYLAGYGLDILAALASSFAHLLMVGDPRQVTYLTHHERRLGRYAEGGIVAFLKQELPRKVVVEIDETSLNRPHRNSAAICAVSSRLFPALPASHACECAGCRRGPLTGGGVFILKTADYANYPASVRPMQLRDKITSSGVDKRSPVMNFGESKGRGCDHVVILATAPMQKWLVDPKAELKAQSRAKFYVALTRGRHSVAIAMNWKSGAPPAGFALYQPTSNTF